MIEFREALYNRLQLISQAAVGPGSDPIEFVKTFDKRLKDVDITSLPELIINVRMAEKLLPGEIGNAFSKYTWTSHFYYLDMEVDETKYDVADNRRNHILGRLEKALELNRFLKDDHNNPLRSVDDDGREEVIYDSSIQAITFDQSGQEGYETFASELFFEVFTDRQ